MKLYIYKLVELYPAKLTKFSIAEGPIVTVDERQGSSTVKTYVEDVYGTGVYEYEVKVEVRVIGRNCGALYIATSASDLDETV